MTPVQAEAQMAFIKERRHGKPLPKTDFPGLINASAAQINAAQEALREKLKGVVIRDVDPSDLDEELQRLQAFVQRLKLANANALATLQATKEERQQLMHRLESHQNTSWGGQPPEATLLSHLGAVSRSFGGKR